MSEKSAVTPMERFLAFMIADIEGDHTTASELEREMAELNEVPSSFPEMRRRLRQCTSVEELHRVYRSFA